MRRIVHLCMLPALLVPFAGAPTLPGAAITLAAAAPRTSHRAYGQEAAERRQDIDAMRRDLESELRFLHRAHRAFFFAHMSTTDVKARIEAGEARIALLERAARDPEVELPAAPDRAALEDELAFLERAHRAFFASHRSTTEVKARIAAVKKRLNEIGEGG